MSLPVKTKFGQQSGTILNLNLAYLFGHPSGNVLYVHNSGTSTGPGDTPERAYSTLDAAIGGCTADNGDVILMCEEHAETITGAAGIAQDVAGVRIIGLGVGRNRPKITFGTADAASWDVSAARCSIENVVLINARDAQTAMVNVSAADVVIQDCEFMLGDGTTQAVLGILTTAGANRLIVRRNHMHGTVTAGCSAGIRLVGGDGILIEDNVITGAFSTTGNIENITTAGTMWTIRRNHLLNRTADGNNLTINVHADTTGLIVENRGGVIDSMSPAPVVAAAMHVGGNWWSSAAGVTASVLM